MYEYTRTIVHVLYLSYTVQCFEKPKKYLVAHRMSVWDPRACRDPRCSVIESIGCFTSNLFTTVIQILRFWQIISIENGRECGIKNTRRHYIITLSRHAPPMHRNITVVIYKYTFQRTYTCIRSVWKKKMKFPDVFYTPRPACKTAARDATVFFVYEVRTNDYSAAKANWISTVTIHHFVGCSREMSTATGQEFYIIVLSKTPRRPSLSGT